MAVLIEVILMDQDFISAAQRAMEEDKRLSKNLAEGVRIALDSLRLRQHTFDEKKKSVQEEIERGSKGTKHRISL